MVEKWYLIREETKRKWRFQNEKPARAKPRRHHAGSSVLSRWRLGVVALVHWPLRDGASALSTLSRWRTGVVALARRERDGALLFFIRLDILAYNTPDRQTWVPAYREKMKPTRISGRIPVL